MEALPVEILSKKREPWGTGCMIEVMGPMDSPRALVILTAPAEFAGQIQAIDLTLVRVDLTKHVTLDA